MIFRTRLIWISFVLVLIPASFNSCGNAIFGTNLPSQSEDVGTTRGNPMVPLSYQPFQIPSASFSFRVCYTEIVFQQVGGALIKFPVSPKILELNPAGDRIEIADIPPGDYDQVTFIVDAQCAGMANSTELTNDNGSYALLGKYDTIRFYGTRSVDGSGTAWLFQVQPLVDAMATITRSADIPQQLLGNPGAF